MASFPITYLNEDWRVATLPQQWELQYRQLPKTADARPRWNPLRWCRERKNLIRDIRELGCVCTGNGHMWLKSLPEVINCH